MPPFVGPFSLRVAGAISEIPASSWDALVSHEPSVATPFVRHPFLDAIESSGSASPRTGWRPRHLTLWRRGRLVAAAPAYRKDGSDGDFSRDWDWAAAARHGGVAYYPKLVIAVPFTPVTGRRVLASPDEDRVAVTQAIADGARDLARSEGLGAVQVLFPGEEEARALEAAGLAIRLDFQYHWTNAGYRTPAEFLARFSSKRRNAIRRERAAPAREGMALRTVRGRELAADNRGWADAMFELHRSSVDRMEWGMRWVNRGFYRRLLATMPDAVEIVEARRGGDLVAAAFNVVSPSRLYGRYWGCREEHPFLHFNVCLYHSIDECIRRGLEAFEGGAGGEHKLSRGFEPALTRSAYLALDPRLDAAIRRHLEREVRDRASALERWRAESPVLKAAGR